MGRFNCVHCGCEYHDKRFFWEKDEAQDTNAASSSAEIEGITHRSGSKDSAVDPSVPSVEDSGMDDTSTAASVLEGSAAFVLKGSEVDNTPTHEPLTLRMGDLPPAESIHSEFDINSVRVYADVIRASGTAANVTGAATHLSCLGPLSMVGGFVGAASGAAQLQQGLQTPSGVVDPHLVAKGGVTSGVGGSCMVMGALACVEPVLFIAALAVGVVGLSVATVIDATINGLCPDCRKHAPVDTDSKADGVVASHGSESEPPKVVKVEKLRYGCAPWFVKLPRFLAMVRG